MFDYKEVSLRLVVVMIMAVTWPSDSATASAKLTYPGNGHCYQRLENRTSWPAARDQCQALGGYLSTLTSAGENDFVYTNLIQTAGTSGWGGATDAGSEGVWVWITSEVWSYTNWAPGEPNNFGNEDYLELSKLFNRWNDDTADALWHPICEWEPVVEICDGLDNDCDELIDEGPDLDGDGVSICHGDCNDSNPRVYPGAPEICDGLDNDCNLLVDQNDPTKVDNDTDGDGLWDCWELYGIDIDANGVIDLPLNAEPYKANREIRDLFVEIDYMVGANHSHRPRPGALQAVKEAFRTKAITSPNAARPNKLQPIEIHWIMDQQIVEDSNNIDFEQASLLLEHNMFQYGAGCDLGDTDPGCFPDPIVVCNSGNTGYFGSPSDRTSPNCSAIIRTKSFALRHMVFAHDVSSGWHGVTRPWRLDECSSTGLLIAQLRPDLISIVDDLFDGILPGEADDKQAGTIMHELGHSLGLLHGGATNARCKSNYVSVMNDSRLFNYLGLSQEIPGVLNNVPIRTDRDLNYSSEALPTLDETMLVEGNGVGSALSELVIYGFNGNARVGRASSPIDWNVNDQIDGGTVSREINQIDIVDPCGSGGNDVDPNGMETNFLNGHHDWDKVFSCMRLPDAPLPLGIMGGVLATNVNVTSVSFGDESTQNDYLNGSLGSTDFDADGVTNPLDLCPLVSDPNQENMDSDPRGDVCDCAPTDSAAWTAPPSEVLDLAFLDGQTLGWSEAPDFFGATAVQYDTVRSDTPSNFMSAITCVESGDGSDMLSVDVSTPSLGQVYYYLVRARNACPNSEGTLGVSSDGTERIGSPCT